MCSQGVSTQLNFALSSAVTPFTGIFGPLCLADMFVVNVLDKFILISEITGRASIPGTNVHLFTTEGTFINGTGKIGGSRRAGGATRRIGRNIEVLERRAFPRRDQARLNTRDSRGRRAAIEGRAIRMLGKPATFGGGHGQGTIIFVRASMDVVVKLIVGMVGKRGGGRRRC